MERVSAIIVSYNAAAFIAEALDSALAQTHRPFEILVLDDSTDDTPKIVERYAQQHGPVVKLVRVERCNVSIKRNMGLDLAKGDYLAFLDADDIWLPSKTQEQLGVLRDDGGAVGAFSPYFDFVKEIDDRGRKVQRQIQDDPDLATVILEQLMSSSTMLFRRSAAVGIRFDEKGPDAEDTIFACELRLKGRWRLAPRPLIAKRIHPKQTSGNNPHGMRNVATRLRWLEEHAARIGPEAGPIRDRLAAGLMMALESCYWRRDLVDLKWMLADAKRICPAEYERSFLARTRILPRWVYRFRDLFSKRPTG